jgi:hypothetical protein
VDDVVSEARGAAIFSGLTRRGACAAALLLSLTLAAGVPATARAGSASANVPPKVVKPGDPGSSQYQEDVPSAFGSVPVSNVSARVRHPDKSALPHAVVTQLETAGPVGRATAALAAAGTPQASRPAASRSRSSARRGRGSGAGSGSGAGNGSARGTSSSRAREAAAVVAAAGPGRSIPAALVHTLLGAGSDGALLAILLASGVLLVAPIAKRRRRRGVD